MLRFLTFLLGRQYEPCKSCETLKEQLLFERDEKKRLTDMLLEIIKPKVVVEEKIINMEPLQPSMTTFSRRRAALEEKDRIEASLRASSKIKAEPDNNHNDSAEENSRKNILINRVLSNPKSVEELEKELAIGGE